MVPLQQPIHDHNAIPQPGEVIDWDRSAIAVAIVVLVMMMMNPQRRGPTISLTLSHHPAAADGKNPHSWHILVVVVFQRKAHPQQEAITKSVR